jgi:hypothetical protein
MCPNVVVLSEDDTLVSGVRTRERFRTVVAGYNRRCALGCSCAGKVHAARRRPQRLAFDAHCHQPEHAKSDPAQLVRAGAAFGDSPHGSAGREYAPTMHRVHPYGNESTMTASPAVSPSSDDEPERINRNVADLLQELRVAGLGVQMLFGFLLALPFTVRFTQLSGTQRDVYRLSVLGAATATLLLISPVAYHRWVFRRHRKDKLLRLANVEALLGLGMEAFALSCAVALIFSFVGSGWFFSILVGAVIAGFVFLWFALPLFDRISSDR